MQYFHEKFSVVRSLTVLYLIIPSFLFAVGWLRQAYALVSVVVLLCFAIVAIKDIYDCRTCFTKKNNIRDWFLIFSVFLFLVVWVLLSGTGGFGFQTTDYRASNALLKDLIEQDWPIHLTINGVNEKYVYYMAYYLPAALAGRFFGWAVANYFLVIWSLIGAALSFLWFIRVSRVKTGNQLGRIVGMLIVFCLAGGLDLFGAAYLKNDIFRISTQNEWWAGYFQYSSNTTLLYWVPQQALSVWLIISLVVDSVFDENNIKYVGIAIVSGLISSPLGLIGVLPFVCLAVVLIVFQNARQLLNRQVVFLNILSVWVGVMHILYIASNQLKFPMTFAWMDVSDQGRLFKYILVFWFLEFAFLGSLILVFVVSSLFFGKRRQNKKITLKLALKDWEENLRSTFDIDRRQFYLFSLSLVVLLFLPFIRIGVYNDIVMRASIPALFIFWSMVTKILFDSSIRARVTHIFLYSLILAIVLIGFYPAVRGISESVEKYHVGPPELEMVSHSSEANSKELVLQRIGNDGSFFYKYIGK